jgi:phospholipase D1/2
MEILNNLKAKFDNLEAHFRETDEEAAQGDEKHSHTHFGAACHKFHHQHTANRFHSFAPIRARNDAKWFVDGCGYMWAVSVALDEATESIWILDWWLSPELYLRRPPSANSKYRLDTMLLAAAERGVKVNIIIYKEVASILTCEPHVST